MNKQDVFVALVELERQNGYPPKIRQIAKRLHPDRPSSYLSSVHQALRKLVADGLVEQVAPETRRGVYISLCQPEDVNWKGDNGDGQDAKD